MDNPRRRGIPQGRAIHHPGLRRPRPDARRRPAHRPRARLASRHHPQLAQPTATPGTQRHGYSQLADAGVRPKARPLARAANLPNWHRSERLVRADRLDASGLQLSLGGRAAHVQEAEDGQDQEDDTPDERRDGGVQGDLPDLPERIGVQQ